MCVFQASTIFSIGVFVFCFSVASSISAFFLAMVQSNLFIILSNFFPSGFPEAGG